MQDLGARKLQAAVRYEFCKDDVFEFLQKKHPFWQMNTVFLLVRRDDGLTRLMWLENPSFIDGFPIKAIKASIQKGDLPLPCLITGWYVWEAN